MNADTRKEARSDCPKSNSSSCEKRLDPILLLLPLGSAVAQQRAHLLRSWGGAEAIPEKYIVKFKDDLSANSFEKRLVSGADHVFEGGFNGFSASLKDAELEALLDDPNVSSCLSFYATVALVPLGTRRTLSQIEYVEQDAVLTTTSAAYTQQLKAPLGTRPHLISHPRRNNLLLRRLQRRRDLSLHRRHRHRRLTS